MKVSKVICTGFIAALFIVFAAYAQEFSPTLGVALSNSQVGQPTEVTFTMEQDYGELDCDSVYTIISQGTIAYGDMSPSDVVGGGTALMAGGLYTIAYDLVVFSVNPAEDRASIQGEVTVSNHPDLPVGSILYHMDVEGNTSEIMVTEWSENVDPNNWTMGTEIATMYDALLTLPYAENVSFNITCVSEPDNGSVVHYYQETIDLALGVEETPAVAPLTYSLAQNYPNPFNSSTVISYQVPAASRVVLNVYSTEGRLVRTLVNGEATPGSHNVIWNGLSNSGTAVATGVYFYRLQAGDFSAIQKMVYLK
jgi:hypothetical protein